MKHLHIKCVTVGAVQTNCYIVINDKNKEGFIIDPGDDFNSILRNVETNEAKIKAVLLTHGHFDHIGAATQCAEYFNSNIYASVDELDMLEDTFINAGEYFGILVQTKADCSVKDKEILNISGIEIEVIATPGHTKGGVCYLIKDEKVLFSGDTLFFEGYGRYDLPTADAKSLKDSLKNRLFILDDDIEVFPGHGRKTSIGYEKKNNPCLYEI